MISNSPWDEIDAVLLGALTAPITLTELIEASGLTGDIVKALLIAYVRCGHAVSDIIRYQITDIGRARLNRIRSQDDAVLRPVTVGLAKAA